MNKFGTIKSKILQNLTEAYAEGRKDEIKSTLKLLTGDKNFLNMYLFYEEVDNKNIEDKSHAELFVEKMIPLLKKHSSMMPKFMKVLDKKFEGVTVGENEIYSSLDVLFEEDSLKNIDKKIIAKKKLVDHLMKKKEISEPSSVTIIENTALLHNILTNNFNVLYVNTLSEDEKKQLTSILSMSTDDFETLKEEVTEKMDRLLTEEKNDELKQKLNMALKEVKEMDVSKYNHYKLQLLKSGL